MEAKDTILSKQQVKQALIDAKCPQELRTKIGEDILIWWKAGWIQEILLAQKKAGVKEVVEDMEEAWYISTGGRLAEFERRLAKWQAKLEEGERCH